MYHRGFSVVEIVVAAAIIVAVVTTTVSAWHLYFTLSNNSSGRTQAALLSEEASEALNFLRDKSWTTNINPLSNNTTYYIYWNGSQYTTTTTPVTVNNIYTVALTLGSVYRDGNFDLSSSGTLDADSRYATITVAYAGNASSTIMQTGIILHNVFKN